MSDPKDPTDAHGPEEDSAFARGTPPHVDPADPEPEVDEQALDTTELADGGAAGA